MSHKVVVLTGEVGRLGNESYFILDMIDVLSVVEDPDPAALVFITIVL